MPLSTLSILHGGTGGISVTGALYNLGVTPTILPPITPSDWSTYAASGITRVDNPTSISITASATGTTWAGVMKALPSKPYDVVIEFQYNMTRGNGCAVGLILVDSVTWKCQTCQLQSDGSFSTSANAGIFWIVNQLNSFNSWNSNLTSLSGGQFLLRSNRLLVKVRDDNTTRSLWYSGDGVVWNSVWSGSNTTWITTPTHVGITMLYNGVGASSTLVGYLAT